MAPFIARTVKVNRIRGGRVLALSRSTLYAVGMTNGTTTQLVEARDIVVGDMTDHGPVVDLITYWDGVTIVTEGVNPRTGATFTTQWTLAPTQFLRVTR